MLMWGAETIVVDRDNFEIRESRRVEIRAAPLRDADGNGVIHITGDQITVDFTGTHLRGAAAGQTPDLYTGTGIRITGRKVTVRGARISGFKCGILAVEADGLTLLDCDVSDNFRQRLRSTPQAEDGADWLWPHRNDEREWVTHYGAGICLERCARVTVERCRARRVQNGLILDRVSDSRIFDNDFSFLSGWGVALWRSSRNVISRNALDFCVRGYSHGVYNRGQDSAGILMFEQNHENLIAENSATHGGDGFFGFAGREALGELWRDQQRERVRRELGEKGLAELRERLVRERGADWAGRPVEALLDTQFAPDPEVIEQHRRRGNNDNLLIGNDFSYAAAHGIEMTFSFGNRLIGNRLVENAICGIWAGYSQDTQIAGNTFERNGEMGYGLERGGVNIEHGRNNRILNNTFRDNRCAIHLWWDDDGALLELPWSKANNPESADNQIMANTFEGDRLVLHLRETKNTVFAGNRMSGVGREFDATPGSEPVVVEKFSSPPVPIQYEAFGKTRPVGARPQLAGRDKIIMTEWGPYDWEGPYLHFVGPQAGGHVYRLLGQEALEEAAASGPVNVTIKKDSALPLVTVSAREADSLCPYELTVRAGGQTFRRRDTLLAATWQVRFFAWKTDPREDVETWHREAQNATSVHLAELDLKFAHGGPAEAVRGEARLADAALPRDRFGTIATTRLTIPAGRWTLSTTSDDGVRVWVDGRLVIDNWTWHGPTVDTAELSFEQPTSAEVRVEHFELDGYAVLSLKIEPANASP
jgi:parallel beta-helix repeat protein